MRRLSLEGRHIRRGADPAAVDVAEERPSPEAELIARQASTLLFAVDGLQRNQGLEWNIFGEPLPGFRALGGVSLMDGRLVNTASALTNGMKATGVPDVQLNLAGEWDASFLRGLTFSGRVIYTSMRYLDPANTQSIPSWTRFDTGVRYTFERPDGKPVSLRFNVENLFDLNYWPRPIRPSACRWARRARS